jgi:hypothetical protein
MMVKDLIIFIVNEKLKKGLEDWPKATSSIETEFVKDYDPITAFTLKPSIRNQIRVASGQMDADQDAAEAPYEHLSNTLSGLDLSYEDLRLYRNFSTAKIVKWDSNINQLYLTDFSNRSLFMGDPIFDIADTLRTTPILSSNQQTLATWSSVGDNFANLQGNISFTFNDWPIIGDNGENGYRQGVEINHQGFGKSSFYKKTMTPERVEWCIELFKWYDRQIVGFGNQLQVDGSVASFNQLPYREFLDQAQQDNVGRTEAALNVFSSYFTPWYVNGNMKWYGLQPYRRPSDNREHSFNTSRNAPCYYYRSGGQPYVQEDIINGHDMLFGIGKQQIKDGSNNTYSSLTYENEVALEGQDPMNYVSHYQKAIRINDDKSQIKVIRPDLIIDFVNEFKLKLNEGLTRIGSTPGIVSGGSVGNGGGSVGASTSGGTGISTGGSAPATGGGGTGY